MKPQLPLLDSPPRPNQVLMPGDGTRPAGWVTIRRRRDGYLMHTPAWAWRRIEGKTDVAELVVGVDPAPGSG